MHHDANRVKVIIHLPGQAVDVTDAYKIVIDIRFSKGMDCYGKVECSRNARRKRLRYLQWGAFPILIEDLVHFLSHTQTL